VDKRSLELLDVSSDWFDVISVDVQKCIWMHLSTSDVIWFFFFFFLEMFVYKRVISKIFRTDTVQIIKLT
jgi:hypothetical protein